MRLRISLLMSDGEQHKTLNVQSITGDTHSLNSDYATVDVPLADNQRSLYLNHNNTADTSEKVKQLESRIIEINDNNSQLRHDLNSAQSTIDDLQKQLTKSVDTVNK